LVVLCAFSTANERRCAAAINRLTAFMPFQILNATLPLFLARLEKVKQGVLFMSTGIPITNKADRRINTKALKNMHEVGDPCECA